MAWLVVVVQPCGRLFCAAACSSARVLDQIWGVGSTGHGVAYDSPSCGAAIRSMYIHVCYITLYLSIIYLYLLNFTNMTAQNCLYRCGQLWWKYQEIAGFVLIHIQPGDFGAGVAFGEAPAETYDLQGQFQAFWRGASESSNENLGNEPVSRNLGGVWLYAPTYFILFLALRLLAHYGPLI